MLITPSLKSVQDAFKNEKENSNMKNSDFNSETQKCNKTCLIYLVTM